MEVLEAIQKRRTVRIPFTEQEVPEEIVDLLEAVRGRKSNKTSGNLTPSKLKYVLEAARWAPTGFNVQPFEFVIQKKKGREPNRLGGQKETRS